MAMNVGRGGRGDPDVMIDINTTPLIDVMLVLLVMLIITIPIQLHAVNLNMPTGNPPPPLMQAGGRQARHRPGSAVFWNGELMPDRADARGRHQARCGAGRQPEVHLRRQGGEVRRRRLVMASAQRLGLTKIGIVGSEQFIE